jgi:hypothetical protein
MSQHPNSGMSQHPNSGMSNYYLYAFVPADVVPQQLTGVLGGQLEVLVSGAVGLLAETADASQFAAQLHAARDDLPWIAARAVVHDSVIAAHMNRGAIPLRFGTLVESGQLEALFAGQPELERRLNSLAGKHEYTVRLWAERSRFAPKLVAADALLSDLQVQIDSLPKNKAYLLERRLQAGVENALKAALPDLRAFCFDVLANLTDAVQPSQKLPAASDGLVPLLEVAILLGATEQAMLEAELSAWQERYGVTHQMTGPFAPYNFTQGVKP